MKKYSDNARAASNEMLVIPSADTDQEAHVVWSGDARF
jgi:hypothetical protein